MAGGTAADDAAGADSGEGAGTQTPGADSAASAAARSGLALVDAVAAGIRDRILAGDIPIGAQLRQGELATLFGVSRMPVREALRQLQASGLIEVHPNRGAVVRVPAPSEVREVFEARAELEALAARRAAARITRDDIFELRSLTNRSRRDVLGTDGDATPGEQTTAPHERFRANNDFHLLIAGRAGNGRLSRMIGELHDAFPRNILAQELRDTAAYGAANFAEHDRIVDALEAGDAAYAAYMMRDHVLRAGEQLARWFERRAKGETDDVPG